MQYVAFGLGSMRIRTALDSTVHGKTRHTTSDVDADADASTALWHIHTAARVWVGVSYDAIHTSAFRQYEDERHSAALVVRAISGGPRLNLS